MSKGQNYNEFGDRYYITYEKETGLPQVYSTITKKVLKPTVNKNGYKQVTVINVDGQSRTMNFARFLMILSDPKDDYTGLQVDHINKNCTDDRLENLRWVSASENTKNRRWADRPNRGKDIIVLYDSGECRTYTFNKQDDFNIPYITIYTLAVAKEGSHYSRKHKITCYYKDEYEKQFKN